MRILQDYNENEIKDILLSLGEKSYRAKQILRGFSSGRKLSEITDLSKDFRNVLTANYCDLPVEIIEKKVSEKDGTVKYLFRLFDGNVIEGVLMKYKYGNTQCVSTQVGCRMGCTFCASTLGGLVRNLSAGEIFAQIAMVNADLGGNVDDRKVTNVVLMGSGEPLDNYDSVVKFIRNISAKESLNVSPRNISLSTCGLVPKIYDFAEENLPVNLTISLHNPFDDDRKKLMPIANSYSVKEILDACSYYFGKTGRRYIFEYSLVKGVNDTKRCADELIKLLKGRPCHVNLIRLNAVKERNLEGTSEKDARRFMSLLENGGISVTLRRQMGNDIDGACGQLRRKFLKSKEEGAL